MELNQLLAILAFVSSFLLEDPVNGVKFLNHNPAIEMMHRYGIKSCKSYEVGNINGPTELIPFDRISRGLLVRNGEIYFEYYVITTGLAHIYFTNTAIVDTKLRHDYAIILGCMHEGIHIYRYNNRHHSTAQSYELGFIKFKSDYIAYKLNIVITTNGKITVYVDNRQILSGKDPNSPLSNLAYLGFSAFPERHSTFFFNCTTIYD